MVRVLLIEGMSYYPISLLAVVILFANCSKKSHPPESEPIVNSEQVNGLPENYKKINGFFYAIYWGIKKDTNYFKTANKVATFSDPPSDILGNFNHYKGWIEKPMNKFANIDYNGVAINGYSLQSELFNGNFFYQKRLDYIGFDSNINSVITTGSNGSFQSLNLTVQRGFPHILPDNEIDSLVISPNNDFEFDLRKFVRNVDSVAFSIRTGPYLAMIIKKSTVASSPIILFTSKELAFIKPYPDAVVAIEAFNYSNQTVNGKQFVYELAVRIDREVRVDTLR